MFPERTEQLALVNPIGLEDWKALGVPYRTVDENYAQELKTTPESIREYERMSYFGGQWKPRYDALIEIPAGWSKDPDYPIVAWNSRTDVGHDLHAAGSLRVSTGSHQDAVDHRPTRSHRVRGRGVGNVRATLGNYPVLGRNCRTSLPHAKLVEIAGVGHLPQIEAFDQYSQALLGSVTSEEG